jgi:DHA2 family multidrug resistance protein
MQYTPLAAGIVSAPSGLGTMAAMVIVGRMVGKVDLRLILAIGFILTAASLWWMCQYTIVLSQSDIIWPGVVQGFGLGLVFVPLSAATFATLPGNLRPDGTAIYSLVRNIGSSIGIAWVQALLVSNMQAAHDGIVSRLDTSSQAFRNSVYGAGTPSAATALNSEISRQASMIAYVDDFWLMFILTLLAIPLLLLIQVPKKPKPTPGEAQKEEEQVELAALE